MSARAIMRLRASRRNVLLVAAAILLVVGVVGSLVTRGGDDAELILLDGVDDCREAGRDTGDRCDVGAEVETVRLTLDGDALTAEVALLEPPDLSSGISWTLQFFVELENEVICGLSNELDEGPVADTLTAYAIDPASRQLLGPTACEGELNGATAVFKINTTGQPPDAEFRVLGSVRLDFPSDRSQPGSEDDFLMTASLAAL